MDFLLALVAMHAVAAIWHHFIKRDGVTVRMIEGAAVKSTPP